MRRECATSACPWSGMLPFVPVPCTGEPVVPTPGRKNRGPGQCRRTLPEESLSSGDLSTLHEPNDREQGHDRERDTRSDDQRKQANGADKRGKENHHWKR